MSEEYKEAAVIAAMNAPISPNLQSYGTYVSQYLFR